ncbi:ankyrin repeat-containing domain protein [Aspergillus heterothallicus]
MPLLDLPNELLNHIGKSIVHEADINAFARTNHLLYKLANPHLYRHNAQHSFSSALIWAAKEGRESTAQLCLDHGAKTADSIEWDGLAAVTPLYLAAAMDRLAIVRMLLGEFSDQRIALVAADSMSPMKDRTLLSWAAEKGSTQVVAYLISLEDVDPDAKDDGGATPLWRAAEWARAGVVRVLLGTGRVNVNFLKVEASEYEEPQTVLAVADWILRLVFDVGPDGRATAEDCNETMKLLLAYEKTEFRLIDDKLIRIENDGVTDMTSLLYHTAQVGPVEIVQLLLRRGGCVNCDAFGGDSRTLVSWAACNGQSGAVRVLVEHGAKVDSRDRTGRTPLSWAAGSGWSDTVQCLLELGAEVDSKDHEGHTPLWFALLGHADDAVKVLRAHGAALPHLEPKDVADLLSNAVEYGNLTIAALLLGTGIDPNVRDEYGRTPLVIAAYEGQKSMVELLLNTDGVDPGAKDREGSTPLLKAIGSSHVEIAKLLLADTRVDVNVKNNNGDNAVSRAAIELVGTDKDESWGSREASMLLLLAHQGTIIEANDDNLQDILSYAIEQDSTAMVKLILKRWADRVLITDESVIDAARNAGRAVLEVVLQQHKPEINEDMLKAAAGNTMHGQAVMELLLDQHDAHITDDVLKVAVANNFCGKQIISLFLDRYDQVPVSHDVMKAAARKGDIEVFEFLLTILGNSFNATEDVFEAAAGNEEHGGDILLLLLTRSTGFQVTENILKAAITNAGSGRAVLQVLLDRSDNVLIDKKTLCIVVQHWKTGEAIMDLCISHYQDQDSAIDAVIDVAARNTKYGPAVIQYLYSQENSISTSRIGFLTAIKRFDKRILALIYNQCSQPIQVDDEVVKAAAGNRNGKAVMELFLERNGGVQISEETFKALEAEKPSGKWITRLFRQRGIKPKRAS